MKNEIRVPQTSGIIDSEEAIERPDKRPSDDNEADGVVASAALRS